MIGQADHCVSTQFLPLLYVDSLIRVYVWCAHIGGPPQQPHHPTNTPPGDACDLLLTVSALFTDPANEFIPRPEFGEFLVYVAPPPRRLKFIRFYFSLFSEIVHKVLNNKM